MKILCVHRYFWPDVTPQATILRAIAARWVADGHDVTVVAGQPSYGGTAGPGRQAKRDTLDGIDLRRVSLPAERKEQMGRRAVNSVAFLGRAVAHLLTRRSYDMVVALTTPPILPALTLGTAARLTGASFVYHCLDIYPEIAVANGDLVDGRRSRLLRAVDGWSARHADLVVVPSRDMQDCQRRRGVDPERTRVVQNLDIGLFVDGEALPAALTPAPGKRTVLFAGNLGRFQGLDVVMRAAHALADRDDVQFVFLGHGVREGALRRSAGPLLGRTVFFPGHHSIAVARAALDAAEVALVTLNPDVGRYAYPSKAVSAMRAGRPIVAMIEPDTELGRSVREHGLGLTATPGDARGLADAIVAVLGGDTVAMGARSREFYEANYARDVVLDAWSAVAAEIEAGRPGRPGRPVRSSRGGADRAR